MEEVNLYLFITILILVDGFLQFYEPVSYYSDYWNITILILVDGFLQYSIAVYDTDALGNHNPYFSRWFSAIKELNCSLDDLNTITILILVDGFLQ